MGLNPMRAGGSAAYAIAQRGLITTDDAYGPGTAAMTTPGIVAAAGGAYSARRGLTGVVSAAPPTLRADSATPSGSSIPVIGTIVDAIPGGSGIHLVVWAVLVFLAIRFVLREVD